MRENRKQRNIPTKTLFAAMVLAAALLSSNAVLARGSAPESSKATFVQQQNVTVTGKVLDNTGAPVIGASVYEKGTKNGSMTDMDGRFTLKVKAGASVTVSYIGYLTQSVKASRNMVITLQEDNKTLGEVVVVGYGSQKKENLTGAVASVDVNKTLESRPIVDVGRGLQGSTPGLSITIPDAEIGSDPTIKIRGQLASLNGSTAPLILLDNVEIPSITLVNPDDIESISVLKDAAASSIYGAKAAFGVVLISTKKGAKTDKVNITYSGNFAWQSTEKGYNMGGLDAWKYIRQADKNAGSAFSGAFFKITEEGIAKAEEWEQKYGGKIGKDDPYVYGRDWYVNAANQKIGLRPFNAYDYMVRQGAPSQTHNLSLSGKSGNTTYNIGLGYLDQTGMNKTAKDDSFQRYNASLRLSTKFNKWVTVNAGTIYSKRLKKYPYTTQSSLDQWYYVYRWGTQYPMGYDQNGHELRSPAEEYHQANTAKYETNYVNINLGLHLDLTKNWTADFDYTHANQEVNWFRPGIRFSAADTWSAGVKRVDESGNPVCVNSNGDVVASGTDGAMQAYDLRYYTYTGAGSLPDDVSRRSSNMQQNTINAYTTYNYDLNADNHFKVMLGMNRVSSVTEWSQAQKKTLLDYDNVQFGNASGDQFASGGKSWESQLGFFGRINYNFMDKYLVEANLRYDGTSKFPKDMRWRWFPSFSAGWRASEEVFMDWAKPVLSTLKVRGSWGKIGDQTVSNSLYVSNLGSINQSSWLDENGNKINSVSSPTAIARDITWQDITTLDFGLDARFFNNELGVTFDWYQRDTKNMIVPAEGVADTYGTTAPNGNYGNLRTRGWELAIDYNHRFKNGLGINAMFTLSDAKTTITDYGSATNIYGWYNGKTYGEIWGYEHDRLYQKSDFVYNGDAINQIVLTEANGDKNAGKTCNQLADANGVYQGYLQAGSFKYGPGDVKFRDLDGDGQITSGSNSVKDHGDLKVIGNSTPRYEFGLRLGANYKGIDCAVFLQGVAKRDMWGSSSTTLPGFNTGDGAVASRFCSDYWTEENTGAFYPRPWNMANSTNAFNMYRQDKYLLNMAYLRIKNITVGYTLPEELTKVVFIQKARFYVSLENFFTFDHLSGTPVDPEIVAGVGSAGLLSGSNYQLGRAGLSTPAFKSFSVGVQLNF
jgi:TonB-linked SusC/RagA family outer membrane protein